jgi:hypothetical protein
LSATSLSTTSLSAAATLTTPLTATTTLTTTGIGRRIKAVCPSVVDLLQLPRTTGHAARSVPLSCSYILWDCQHHNNQQQGRHVADTNQTLDHFVSKLQGFSREYTNS